MHVLCRFQVLARWRRRAVRRGAGLTIKVDYSKDATNFFGGGNPNGAAAALQAKAAMDAAAAFYSGIMEDTLSSIGRRSFPARWAAA